MQGTSLKDIIKNKLRQKLILIHTLCDWPKRLWTIFLNILEMGIGRQPVGCQEKS